MFSPPKFRDPLEMHSFHTGVRKTGGFLTFSLQEKFRFKVNVHTGPLELL